MENKDDSEASSLKGLFEFAAAILRARSKTQLRVDDYKTKLGCFREHDLNGLPGLTIAQQVEEVANANWLKLERLKKTNAPLPAEPLLAWVEKSAINDPSKLPVFHSSIHVELAFSIATEMMASGQLLEADIEYPESDSQDVHSEVQISEIESPEASIDSREAAQFSEANSVVSATLHLENDPAITRDLERWRDADWSEWAELEKQTRRSIKFYLALYKLHTIMSSGDSGSSELIWGVGMVEVGKASKRVDMPLVELPVELELDNHGTITVTPRQVSPKINLQPLIEVLDENVDNASELINKHFDSLIGQENIAHPYAWDLWQPLCEMVATQFSATGRYLRREQIEQFLVEPDVKGRSSAELTVSASWTLFGRPRSTNALEQDLKKLSELLGSRLDDNVPEILESFVSALPDGEESSEFDIKGGEDKYSNIASEYSQVDHAAERNYFPLAYNEEQAKIVEALKQNPVVTVTGPPGTGKTHTIANIVAHYMATGRRVLVTARTAEAIAAVQSKLPDDLASLVIASVGSDRAAVEQLESTIQKLSDDVISIDKQGLEDQIQRTENLIAKADIQIAQFEENLRALANKNFKPMRWDDEKVSVMDLAQKLQTLTDEHAWFVDRPSDGPPKELADELRELRELLELHATDLPNVNAKPLLPKELPAAFDLIDCHQRILATNEKPTEDLSDQPEMAKDGPESMDHARKIYAHLDKIRTHFLQLSPWCQQLIALECRDALDTSSARTLDVRKTLAVIGERLGSQSVCEVSIDVGAVDDEKLISAVQAKIDGSVLAQLKLKWFNKSLSKTMAGITIDARAPESKSDWVEISRWLNIKQLQPVLRDEWSKLEASALVPAGPAQPHEWQPLIDNVERKLVQANMVANSLLGSADELHRLFPYGLDARQCLAKLDFDTPMRAIRANVSEETEAPGVIAALEAISVRGETPVFLQARSLLNALGKNDTDEQMIISWRNELTEECERLHALQEPFLQINRIIKNIEEAGAPVWSQLISDACDADDPDAYSLVKLSWFESWQWALARRQVDDILALGNGETIRARKLEAIKLRERYFLDLIRSKTLHGLERRLTPEVRSALSQFTTAVRRFGAGGGKSAARWRHVMRKSAQVAASATPVWIMPESKVVEQISCEFDAFDLVVLDEASQSDITSLGVLSRGSRLLIVGDEKQVSPGSAIGITTDNVNALRAKYLANLPSRDSYDERTSIFDIAMQRNPQSHLMLKEHFRCVEPIIQFSTRFYNCRLEPLRVPKASERFDPPLVDVYIEDGERLGKTNEAEAHFIVNEIATITSNRKHSSRGIAVISLVGREQAEYIEKLLLEDGRIGPDVMRHHNLVCGDSRTMQGQERSVVFLSMVNDPGSARNQRSREDEQRFNVAMSRACDRLYLVRSVAETAFKPDDLKLAVINHFKHPIPEGNRVTRKDVLERCDSNFERDVAQHLLDAGYRVRSQVSAGKYRIDLVVEGEDDRRLAVELDGDHWHGPDQWDKDMQRQATLERAGWTFWRVFGSQWYSAKEHFWLQLQDTLTDLGINPIGGSAVEGDFTEYRCLNAEDVVAVAIEDLLQETDVLAEEFETQNGEMKDTSGLIESDKLMPEADTEHVDYPLEDSVRQSRKDPAQLFLVNEQKMITPSSLNNADLPNYPELSPAEFYNADYRKTIGAVALNIIDFNGPVTSTYLAKKIARLHGFQRTGVKIRDQVRASILDKRVTTQSEYSQVIYWPENTSPAEVIEFRGLDDGSEHRTWGDLPFPERIGLAREALAKSNDPMRYMKDALGISRIGGMFQSEIRTAIDAARSLDAGNASGDIVRLYGS